MEDIQLILLALSRLSISGNRALFNFTIFLKYGSYVVRGSIVIQSTNKKLSAMKSVRLHHAVLQENSPRLHCPSLIIQPSSTWSIKSPTSAIGTSQCRQIAFSLTALSTIQSRNYANNNNPGKRRLTSISFSGSSSAEYASSIFLNVTKPYPLLLPVILSTTTAASSISPNGENTSRNISSVVSHERPRRNNFL